jgi:hypothetical protein
VSQLKTGGSSPGQHGGCSVVEHVLVGLVEAEHFEAEWMAGVEHGEGALVGYSKIAVVDLRGKKGELEDK